MINYTFGVFLMYLNMRLLDARLAEDAEYEQSAIKILLLAVRVLFLSEYINIYSTADLINRVCIYAYTPIKDSTKHTN